MFPITYGDQQKTTIGFERSAKPLCAGSIPARASNSFNNLGRPIPESALSGCQYGCQLALPPSSVRRLDSHLPLTIWFRAIWQVTSQKNGISALGLQRVLGLGSYKTAWAMLHKLRRAMVRPGRDRLSGTVEVDET